MKLREAISVKELSDWLNAEYNGPGELQITGLNEIHKVAAGDLTFVDVPKYYGKALSSDASVIIINNVVSFPEGKALIISRDPFHDYNRLVKRFMTPEVPSKKTGVLMWTQGNNVEIQKETTIYPGVVIGNNVSIGKNCIIYPNVVIYDNAVIGNDVIIHANSVIGSHAYYYKTRESYFEKLISCGSVIIQDKVEIGAACTIDKGVSGETVIGEDTKFDNQVHIGHGVVIGKRCLIGAQVAVGGKTIIEDDVVIWGQSGLTKDITIGKGAFIAGQSGVTKSLKGGQAYQGTPAQEIRKAQKEHAWLRSNANKK
ncbi:MAG: UDP-3-O-(3-hydroxymyristoyl)glucosamine N-acyltransferase [Bacteroidota bacterium]|nr:UDP-3-O-(3-hydroxymyristoyl)glucosamine N-acyltransferase [Bacteroidota bacterium]